MKLNDYQDATAATAIYPKQVGQAYCAYGLFSESGEVSGVLKKFLRGDYDRGEFEEKMKYEIGDVLWYVARLAAEFGFPLEDIARANLEKLTARKDNGTIKGDGDDR